MVRDWRPCLWDAPLVLAREVVVGEGLVCDKAIVDGFESLRDGGNLVATGTVRDNKIT